MAKQTKESIFNFTDLSGGYFTNLADAEMAPNEMLVAENAEWDGELRKRKGLQAYSTVTASITIRGGIRAWMGSAWRTFVAKDLGSATVLHHQATAADAWASVNMPTGTAFTLAAGQDVQFAILGERVIGVDGSDEPFFIYETGSSLCADTIERYDERTRETDNWTAGDFYAGTPVYGDDTTDAQSTTADDFPLFGATASTGFFIGCDYTFNKVKMTDVTVTGSVPFVFQYFGYPTYGASATWNTIGTASMIQTTSWATVTNSLVLEWPAPIVTDGAMAEVAMTKLPDMATAGSFLEGKYAVRMYATGVPSATAYCGYMAVGHTQYLSELLLDDKPDTVVEHKNHIFLGCGNWIRNSPPDNLRDWRYDDYQYFKSGGTIKQMVAHGDYLAILMEDKIYGLLGNSWANWSLKEMPNHGGVSKRGAAVVGQNLYFQAEDGIWQWDGRVLVPVTKGLADDFASWTLTNATAVNYKGELWIAYPTNGIALKADPDSFRTDPKGDGRLSFFKFSNYRVDGWLYCKGDSDLGYLLGWANHDPPLIVRADNDAVDLVTSTASIDMIYQSSYMNFGDEPHVKQYRFFKPVVADMASAATATDTKCLYQFSFYSKDSYGIASANATVTVSACSTGIHEEDITIPYGVDGKRLSVYMRHSATCGAALKGYSIGLRRRWF